MARRAYVGVEGIARKVKRGYIGVDDIARRIKKIYIGIGGIARPCFSDGLDYYGTVTPLKTARSRFTPAIAGGCALFFSGQTESTLKSDVDVYDPSLIHSVISNSSGRYFYGATSLNDNALYAGGTSIVTTYMNHTFRYDPSFTTVTMDNLHFARTEISATTIGNYALFAGGRYSNGNEFAVDVYDKDFTHKTDVSLSYARYSVASTSTDGFAFFGGGRAGYVHSTVDAFNKSLTRRKVESLSVARFSLVATTLGEYALFGGGLTRERSPGTSSDVVTDVVDVYDSDLTLTQITPLSVPRHSLSATTVGEFALFGGGEKYEYYNKYNRYTTVDMYDTSLTRTTFTPLSTARSELGAITLGNYGLFAGGNSNSDGDTVDVYALIK